MYAHAGFQKQRGLLACVVGISPPSANSPFEWRWELLSLAFSVGCMISIVAILFTFQDRPQSEWRGGSLSITGTLAIFSTSANMAAALAVGACISQYKWLHFRKAPHQLSDLDLLEEASRGPLGSLTLLTKRPRGLASIGAVVTLLALGFDVFVQQTVSFEPRDVAMDDGNATLGLAHAYDSGATRIGALGTILNVAPSTMDLAMQGAVFRGLYNLGSPAVFNCTTSKCQWNSTYYSLGYTSSCADVTEATIRLHPNASATWNSSSPGRREVDMNLTTPGGIRLAAPFSHTSWQTVVSVNATSLSKENGVSVNADGVRLMSPDIVRIGVFRVPVDIINFAITPANMTIFECDIALAAYKYSNLSSSGQNLTVGKLDTIRLDPGLLTDGENTTAAAHITFNQTGLPLMTVSASDIAGLQLLFTTSRFSGRIYEGLSGIPDQGTGDAFRSGDIAQTMHAMADSMTNQLRSTYNVAVRGLSFVPVVFIDVEWAWITLPLVVQLISITFTVIIIIQSARTAGLPLWKSSTMALLTYDVQFRDDEDDVGRLGSGIRSPKELEALAKSWKARLELPGQT
ncbi:hypothetical protein C8A05DRAFT_46780 [Staphylotrichum tortipilum]|uniref:Uncharacterized protein n=1 Tax=Staphylotrichum tortipilum TaxID=2831512 RepID=A0AAN6MF41_9PEZI|nr:hypothetical protein C8A05DRAFT_46780 [Staphylotrichum longicolle]